MKNVEERRNELEKELILKTLERSAKDPRKSKEEVDTHNNRIRNIREGKEIISAPILMGQKEINEPKFDLQKQEENIIKNE